LHEQLAVVGIERHRRGQGAHTAALDRLARGTKAVAAKEESSLSNSTAWRKDTPLSFITQSMGPPPTPQPKQCHRFFEAVTIKDGSPSSWNGQRPARSLPTFLSSIPAPSTRRCTLTSSFSRWISASGMRAMGCSFEIPEQSEGPFF